MIHLVLLVEERSMKALLDELLPRLWPFLSFTCIAHEGKQDLEKSIPRKLRGWTDPRARFLIIRDKDSADCKVVKERLVEMCKRSGRDDAMVRIACNELEAWFFGDLEALAVAYEDDDLLTLSAKERFRDPDQIVNPSKALQKLIPGYHKVAGARRLGGLLERERNRSRSFRNTLEAVDRLTTSQRVE